MSDVPESVLAQIQKLLNLAANNPNEYEAAEAMAKANERLEQYNLTYEAVVGAEVGSGAREKTAVEGGYYEWERLMWQSVAKLNFCLYWCARRRNVDRTRSSGKSHVRKWLYSHYVVGRKVNVAATKTMATYLLGAATRMTYERARGWNDNYKFDNWANSYRRGVIERVCQRLRVRRDETLREQEERRVREMREAHPGSTATALTLMTYIDQETDANNDFIYGKGWSAEQAALRAAQAAENQRREQEYTKWAAEHPEEAAAKEKARLQRAKKLGRRSRGSRDNLDYSAYWSGYDAGGELSIDHQVDTPRPAGLL